MFGRLDITLEALILVAARSRLRTVAASVRPLRGARRCCWSPAVLLRAPAAAPTAAPQPAPAPPPGRRRQRACSSRGGDVAGTGGGGSGGGRDWGGAGAAGAEWAEPAPPAALPGSEELRLPLQSQAEAWQGATAAPSEPPSGPPPPTAAGVGAAALARASGAAAAAGASPELGGYLVPGVNDGWTWDDDYNEAVLVGAWGGLNSCLPVKLVLISHVLHGWSD